MAPQKDGLPITSFNYLGIVVECAGMNGRDVGPARVAAVIIAAIIVTIAAFRFLLLFCSLISSRLRCHLCDFTRMDAQLLSQRFVSKCNLLQLLMRQLELSMFRRFVLVLQQLAHVVHNLLLAHLVFKIFF